jgi:hypothetical protein
VIADRYNLQTEGDIAAAITDLKGFWKLWSACLLQSVSLPTLRGIIFTHAYGGLRDDLRRFLRKIGATSALIRQDMRDEKPPYPRGGFVVPESLLNDVLEFFFRQNRIVALYEPADPLLNSYNLNLLFESTTDVWAEVLGPGFDASDLQRGDLSPHEVFSIAVSTDGEVVRSHCVRRVDEKEYEESREFRKQKIRRKLKESPTSELADKIRREFRFSEKLEEYLKAQRSPLYDVDRYAPIPQGLLSETVAAIVNSHVIELFRNETNVGFPINLSTSLIEGGKRQVYWDIVSPALKFQGLKNSGLG